MAQFDVHRNQGALRDSIPFVVVVQSSLFERYRRRVVVPLVRASALTAGSMVAGSRMNPTFEIDNIRVVLHPLDIVSVAMDQLGAPIDTLNAQGQAISDALDEVFTHTWN